MQCHCEEALADAAIQIKDNSGLLRFARNDEKKYSVFKIITGLFTALSLTLLAACTSTDVPKKAENKFILEPVSFKQLQGWEEDNQSEALPAFLKSCDYFNSQDEGDAHGQGILLAPTSVWRAVCRKAQLVTPKDPKLAKAFFEESFVPFLVTNDHNPSGLFTGYYEPLLLGSRTQHRPFVYPVYGLPVAGTPSFTRSQIDLGMLAGRAPLIAFVDDPVQLFFLHVQGSGRIQLDSGETIHLNYAGSNGQPYVSIGKALVDKGMMKKEQVSMPALKQWLYDHPNDKWQVMWENTSYIYFKEQKGDTVGTQKVALTAGRSLAVDANYIPLGAPLFVDTMLPGTPVAPMEIMRKLMVAQDTGAAIKGPVRGDIFFGAGAAAEELAGQMRSGGRYIILLPHAIAINLPPMK